MGQFTPIQTEQIKQCVLDCSIKRFTIYETQQYIKQTLGISLSCKTVKNYKARLRLQAQSWIGKLARSKRADYISCYRDRILEIEALQRNLWTVKADDKRTGPRTQVDASRALLDCTRALVELYDCVPLISAIRDYGCGYDHDNKDMLQQQQQDYNARDKTPFFRSGSDDNTGIIDR